MNIKSILRNTLGGAILAMLTPFTASAALLVEDYFDYNLGQLPGQGAWVRGAHDGDQKLNIVNMPLIYDGYQNAAKGKAAYITTSLTQGTDQDAFLPFIDKDNAFLTGKVYASMLVKVEEATTDDIYALCFAQKIRDTGIIEGKSPSEYARLFFKKKSGDDTKYNIGLSRGGAKPEAGALSADLNVGETVLVVICYEFADEATADKVHMWINPACGDTEPQATIANVTGAGNVSRSLGLQGFELRQATTPGGKIGPKLYVDALRIATTWADLFPDQGGDTPSTDAVISPLTTSVSFDTADGYIMQGMTAEKSLLIKAANLTDDITVESSVPGLTLSATTISKDDACSDAGATLTMTLKATDPAALPASIVLKSAGAKDVVINLTGTIVPVTADEARFSALSLVANESGDCYRYTGLMAKVTYVDEANNDIYVQDMTGAIRIHYGYLADPSKCPLKRGDKVKNMYLTRMDDARGPAFIPMTSAIADITAQNSEVDPYKVSFTELKGDLESYLYRLVTVTDVTLNPSEGEKWSTSGIAARDERADGRVRSFAGTDLIGTDVPAFAPSITGISTSKGAPVITMRGAADIETVPAELEISHQLKINAAEYQKINVPVEYAVFTVKATALTKPAAVYIGGKHRSMFSIDREEIPAGTGVYQITVTYTPTTTGKHDANLVIDAVPTELSGSYSMTARAYDPANPPMITVDASAITPFSAKVGETMKQTITYSIKNFVNYGTVKVETPGSFLLSSTSTLMTDGTYTVDVTFAPKAEGNFTNKVIFTADMANTVEIPVTGTTTGGQDPETTQGDELSFDGPALPQYSTDFSSSVANNQPLKLDGWKNVAAQGTRAWWSYTKDRNQVAKVTAYDSRATDATPCQMLLLSPRLDFANAAQRLLCFNVMGELMTDDMTDRLQVCYVDAKAAEADPDHVVYNVIDGLNIPSLAEENGEWARYVLDLDAWELDDEFYIAFVFTSTRGKENSAVYYIDDFSWGRTDMPFIRSSHQLIETVAKPGETMTTEEITATGFNLTQPIKLALAGSDAGCFTLSTTQLPAEGGKFTLDFNSTEVKDHVAIVSMQSGSDALSHVMLAVSTDAAGIGSIDAGAATQWGDTVSVSDTQGRVLMTAAPVSDALGFMKSAPGTLFLVTTADGVTYKYIAK